MERQYNWSTTRSIEQKINKKLCLFEWSHFKIFSTKLYLVLVIKMESDDMYIPELLYVTDKLQAMFGNS